MGSGIAARAGAFLEINYSGGSKDKRIARDLGISPGMAKLLRRGRGWTPARLDQIMQLMPGFREFVFAPPGDLLVNRLEQLAQGFARLGDELARLREEMRDGNAALRTELSDGLGALRAEVRSLRG